VQIDATGSGGASTLAVVMVAGSGDEFAPVDNRIATFIAPTVVVTTTGGGGGAVCPGLLLLFALGAVASRRRRA
jgi:MYXO-CTERM domain-containing protein